MWVSIVIAILFVYFLVSILATGLTWRWAMRRGGKSWIWAASVPLFMWVPILWDWVPVTAAHRYACEAGYEYTVLKDPKEWLNANQAGTVFAKNPLMEFRIGTPDIFYAGDDPIGNRGSRRTREVSLNSRVVWRTVRTQVYPQFLKVWRWETQLVDKATGEVLLNAVDFSSGYGKSDLVENVWKYWLHRGGCTSHHWADRFPHTAGQFNNENFMQIAHTLAYGETNDAR